eukprot:GGOE01021018.1.p1 GENE.GGOE01021018.1~~GGOE01021018.1.p1  ORF type:complete len:287 (-),score=13.76 GGOE01021018.1:248-1042(-)
MTSSTSFFGTPPLTAARPVTPAAELKAGLLLPPDDGSLPPPMPPTGGSPSPLPAMSGPSPSAPPPLSSSPLIVGRSIGELSARCEALEKELAQVVHRLQARDQRDRTANSVGIVVSTVQAPVPEKENDEVCQPDGHHPAQPTSWPTARPTGRGLAGGDRRDQLGPARPRLRVGRCLHPSAGPPRAPPVPSQRGTAVRARDVGRRGDRQPPEGAATVGGGANCQRTSSTFGSTSSACCVFVATATSFATPLHCPMLSPCTKTVLY